MSFQALHGFHQEPLRLMQAAGLSAVVVPQGDESPEPSPDNVTAHHDVVSHLRELGPALPVRFGTVLQSADALTEAIENQRSQLLHDIERLAGKVEYGITALWGSALDEGTEPLTANVKAAESGARYMQQRLAEYQREKQLRELAVSIQSDMEQHLAGCIDDAAVSVLPVLKIPVRGRYLVEAHRSDNFEAAYANLSREWADLRFLLVGPWPPYSFVTAGEDPVLGTHAADRG